MLFPSSFSPAPARADGARDECQFSDPSPISSDDVEQLQTEGYLIVLAAFGRLSACRPIAT